MALKSSALNYIKNVGKSFGYATVDIIKDNNPYITSLFKDTKEVATDAYNTIKEFISKSSDLNIFDTGKQIVNDAWKNVKDDIKTGNWYNKQREEIFSENVAKAMGFDFSDFDFDLDDEFGDSFDLDDGTKASMTQDVKNTQATIIAMDEVGARISGSINKGIEAGAEYIVSSNRSINKALFDLNKTGFKSISESLRGLNTNITGIAESLGKPLTAHMQNATLFYTKTTASLERIEASLNTIAKNTVPINNSISRSSSKRKTDLADILSGGELSISSLTDFAKESVKETMGLFSMLTGGGGGKTVNNLKDFGKGLSPLSWLFKGLVNSFIPSMLKEATKGFNAGLKDLLTGGLVKGIHKAGNSTGILGLLASMLLPKDELKQGLNAGNYEKGAVAWDGIARKALVEVIPTTLFKIYKVLSGSKTEVRYDYDKGKFTTVEDIKGKEKELKNKYIETAGGDLMRDALRKAGNDELTIIAIKKYFEYAFEHNEDYYDINKSGFKDTPLGKQLKNNPEAVAIIKELVQSGKYNGTISHVTSVRSNYNRMLNELESSGVDVMMNNYNNHEAFGDGGGVYSRGGSKKGKSGKGSAASSIYSTASIMVLQDGTIVDPKNEKQVSQYKREQAKLKLNQNQNSRTAEDTIQQVIDLGSDKVKGAQEKVDEVIENNSTLKKIKEFIYAPATALTGLINNMTNAMTRFLWGDGKSDKGIFGQIQDKIAETFKKLFAPDKPLGKLVDKIFGAKGEDGKRSGGIFKDFWSSTKSSLSEYWKWMGTAINEPLSNKMASNGRKVTKTGMMAVSRGELIIPAELNPFYHGHVDKKKQHRDELNAVMNFYGMAGDGDLAAGVDTNLGSNKESETASSSDDAAAPHKKNIFKDAKEGSVLNWVYRNAVDLANGLKTAKDKLIGDITTEEGKKKFDNSLDKVLDELKLNKGSIGAGAIVGGLGGAFLGAPILGMIVGSAAGYVAKSERMQKFLFGDIDDNGDRTGAFFNKELSNFLTKQAPDMVKFGSAGAVGGAFLGSPLLGMIAGSAIGYVKNSSKAQEFLFGKQNEDGTYSEGIIKKELQDRFKKSGSKMLGGALLGGLIGGPFGIFGNMLLGAGVGFVSTNEKVNEFLFGKEENGKKQGGLLNKIQTTILKPITEIFGNLANRFKARINKLLNTVGNLIKKGITGIGGLIKRSLVGGTDKNGKKRKGLLSPLTKALGFTVNTSGNILGHIANRTKIKNLRKGYDVYDADLGRNMLASERAAKRDDLGRKLGGNIFGKRQAQSFSNFDRLLAGAQTQEEVNQIIEMLNVSGQDTEQGTAIRKILKDQGINFNTGDLVDARALAGAELKNRQWETPEEKSLSNLETGLSMLVRKICGVEMPTSKPQIVSKFAAKADKNGNMRYYSLDENGKKKRISKDVYIEGVDEETGHGNTKSVLKSVFNQQTGTMMQLKVNKDGETEVDNSDSETREATETIKKNNRGLHALVAIPGAFAGIKGFFSKIGEKLFGTKEEPSLLGKIKNFLFGNSDTFSLAALIKKVIGPVLVFGALTGKFDGLASALGNLSIFKGNDTKSALADNRSMTVTLSDGTKVQVKTDDKGNILKDSNGNYLGLDGKSIDASSVTNYSSSGSNTKLSAQLKKNFATGLIMGTGSVVSKAASPITSAIGKAINGILGKLPQIIDKIPFLKKFISPESANYLAQKVGVELTEEVAKKASESTAAKILNKLSNAAIVLKIAYVALKGIDAWGNAESILGITEEATTGQKIIATLVAVVNALIPFIGDLVPNKVLVNIFMKIAPKIGIDVSKLQAQRDAAEQEVEAYNAANGTNYSIEDYNLEVKGNAGILSKAKYGIKNFATSVKEQGFGNAVKNSKLGTKIKESKFGQAVGNFSTKIKESKFGKEISNIIDKAKDTITYIKNSTEQGWTLLHTKGSSIKDFFKVPEPDNENPLGGIAKGAAFALRLVTIPIAIIDKIGDTIVENIKTKIDKVKNGITTIYNVNSTLANIAKTGDGPKAIWDYEIPEDEENPISGFAKFVTFGAKLSWTIPSLYAKVGKDLFSGVKNLISEIKPTINSFSNMKAQIEAAVEKGDIGAVWNVNTDDFAEDGALTGLFKFGAFGLKLGGTIKALFNKLFGWLGDLWGGVKEKVGGIVEDVKEKAGNVTEKIKESKVGQAVGEAKDWVVDKAQGVWDKFTGWLSGSGSGFISQFDPKYSSLPYGPGTIADYGCAPAVAAMVSSRYGKNLSMQEAIRSGSKYTDANGTKLSYFPEVLKSHGISTSALGSSSDVYTNLRNGRPVIMIGKDSYNSSKSRSPFGPKPHYVVATGIDKNGNIIISDPESDSSRAYSPNILKNTMANIGTNISGGDSGLLQGFAGLSSIFSNAFNNSFLGRLFSGNSDNTEIGSTADSGNNANSYINAAAPVGVNNSMQAKLVQYARSRANKELYSQDNREKSISGNNTVDRYSDCSSFAQRAYKTILGVDPGGDTVSMYNKAINGTGDMTIVHKSKGNRGDVTKYMQAGDLVYFYTPGHRGGKYDDISHVEMYDGEGHFIGQNAGGPKVTVNGYTKGVGPSVKNAASFRVSDGDRYLMTTRFKNIAKYNTSSSSATAHGGGGRINSSNLTLSAAGSGLGNTGSNLISNVRSKTSSMVSGLMNSIKASASNGSITPDLLIQLITALIQVLEAIADNTAPVGQIFTALTNFNKSRATAKSTTTPPSTNEVDDGFKTIVGQLAAIAKG